MTPEYTWLGMDAHLVVGLLMLLTLTAYALLGGADFGAGVWDLLATGPRRAQQRQALSEAIGPVWEANHVWLIFLLVILFTAFPPAFGALSIAFFSPLHLVLLGIVLRGAAYVFQASAGPGTREKRAWETVFGAGSVITPFLLGAAMAAVSSGGIRFMDGRVAVDAFRAWMGPIPLLTGALTLAICAYLAAVYVTVETTGKLQEDFRSRAIGAWVVVAALPAILLPLIWWQSPLLWEHFARWQSLPPMAVGILLALGSGWSVLNRRYHLARVLAAGEVMILLWGWAFAQWPYLVYPDLTVYNSAVSGPAIRFMLTAVPFGLIILVPSLWLLFAVFKGNRAEAGH